MYRQLDVGYLLANLSVVRKNILILGEKKAWMVNAKSNHSQHFIGTERCLTMLKRTTNKVMWNKLLDFLLRYATPGSDIGIYCLQ